MPVSSFFPKTHSLHIERNFSQSSIIDEKVRLGKSVMEHGVPGYQFQPPVNSVDSDQDYVRDDGHADQAHGVTFQTDGHNPPGAGVIVHPITDHTGQPVGRGVPSQVMQRAQEQVVAAGQKNDPAAAGYSDEHQQRSHTTAARAATSSAATRCRDKLSIDSRVDPVGQKTDDQLHR